MVASTAHLGDAFSASPFHSGDGWPWQLPLQLLHLAKNRRLRFDVTRLNNSKKGGSVGGSCVPWFINSTSEALKRDVKMNTTM